MCGAEGVLADRLRVGSSRFYFGDKSEQVPAWPDS